MNLLQSGILKYTLLASCLLPTLIKSVEGATFKLTAYPIRLFPSTPIPRNER